MNIDIKNVLSIELGEILINEKSDYRCYRKLVITTSDGQVTMTLYTKGNADEDALKVCV